MFLIPYVDLQYYEISLTFTAGSVSLCCVCSHVASLVFREGVVVPYVDAVFAVTVMCVLLFVFHVCILRECDGWMRCWCGECRVCGWYTWFM